MDSSSHNQMTNPPFSPQSPVPPGVGDSVRDTPDVGSRKSRLIATILALLLVGCVFVVQQMGAMGRVGGEVATAEVKAPVGFDAFGSMARLQLRVWGFVEANSQPPVTTPGGGTGTAPIPTQKPPAWIGDVDELRKQTARTIESYAQTDLDKYRSVMTTAFVEGTDAGVHRLDDIESEFAKPTTTTAPRGFEGSEEDIAAARRVLESGAGALEPDQRQRLLDRHGYFAQLLFSAQESVGSQSRRSLTDGGIGFFVFIIVLFLFFIGVAIASITCFIMVCVRLANKRFARKFVPPAPGGSVYLETVALFAFAFLAMQILLAVVGQMIGSSVSPVVLVLMHLGAMWLLVPVTLWARARGVPAAEHARRIGWFKGEGFWREVGAGLFGYFAGLPLVAFALGVSFVAMLIAGLVSGGEQSGPPVQSSSILDMLASGNVVILCGLFTVATLWAPLVEESVFRGSLFRHLRSRFGVIVSALLSALAFAAMHPIPFFLLMPVFTLGFNFALIREWRGSLIATMVMHGLHNAVAVLILISLFQFMTVPAAG